jgi:hypothetical protein
MADAGPIVHCRIRRYRMWVYVLCNGQLSRARRTPELDLWLDKLGIKVSGQLPVTDPD